MSVNVIRAGLLLAFAACASTASAATITLVSDEWCPYNCTPGSDKPGFMIEVATKVFADAGHTVEYSIVPWSRAVEETRKGKYDGAVGATQGDTEGFVFPDNDLGLSANVFIAKKGSAWKFADMGSLSTISLGVIRDYSYGDELDAYVEQNAKDATKVQVASGEDGLGTNIKKLEAGRIGALVEDRNVVEYELASLGKQAAYVEVGNLGEDPLYIAFSPAKPTSAEYAKLLSDGIAKLRASGELAKILEKYGLKDWR